MPKITLKTMIDAPIERVFDLARSIDLHRDSMKETDERAVAGKTSGLIELGETVTWGSDTFRHQAKSDFKNYKIGTSVYFQRRDGFRRVRAFRSRSFF